MDEPDADFEHLETRVIENAKSVDKLLLGSTALVGSIVLLKLKGIPDFSWNDIKFSVTNDALLVFSLLSIAHFFTAYRLIRSTHALWKADSLEHGKTVFQKVTGTGGVFVRELIARVDYRRGIAYPLYQMKLSDPTSWIAYGMSLLLPFAIVPYDLRDLPRFFAYFAGAIFITVLNWVIGSAWIVSLSELTQQHEEAKFHLQLEKMQRKS